MAKIEATGAPEGGTADRRDGLPEIRVPAALTFASLVAGLALALLLAGRPEQHTIAHVVAPVGTLWLHALQMTIVPLVAGLLFTGIVETVAAASAGVMARRTLGWFAAMLTTGAVLAAVLVPLALQLVPIPPAAVAALAGAAPVKSTAVPGIGEFLGALVPENIVDAAARSAMLPLILFVTLFALAATRLAVRQRDLLAAGFAALAGAMMVIIGWVLKVAPIGVFALGFGVAANSGSGAVTALAHYIAIVAGIGGLVLIVSYVVAITVGRQAPGAFVSAMLPVQALALSTQSSLACLPAMLAACRRLGLREGTADFVLPLAVTLFRATGPAMNLAVAIYAAKLTGTPLTPTLLVVGTLVALLTTLGAVSLPGTISFVTSIAPIALAMGVPLGPLALLVAVEILPDLMRTLGNVTMDVAVVTVIDRAAGVASPAQGAESNRLSR